VSDRLRLIFVTQLIDPNDPVLGFTVDWVRALAERCERVDVIANEVRAVPEHLDADVFSLGKERGRSRVARMAMYVKHLTHIVSRGRPHALFAHMCPQYLNAATPILRVRRVRAVLWFAHPRDSRTLRVAERLADLVLTSLPGAFPFRSGKIRVIGQGIDIRRFAGISPPPKRDRLELITLGRLSPVKRYETIVGAVRKLSADRVPIRLRIVGPATNPVERSYARRIRELAERIGPDVSVSRPVSPEAVPALLSQCDVLVNATSAGSGDKVVLEAMASKRPVVYSNPGFDDLTEGLSPSLRFDARNPDDLADRLHDLWSIGPARRQQLGNILATRVAERHSLDGWGDRVVDAVRALAGVAGLG
jgi:glycosyltransferase involved in cell wall biosynthesis